MLGRILNMFAPPLCLCCGKPLVASERDVCLNCRVALPRHTFESEGVLWRINTVAPLGKIMCWTSYVHESPLAEAIRRGKYSGRPRIFSVLGRLMAQDFADSAQLDFLDALLPMPMHWTKRLSRGYNQADVLARELSRVLGAPVADNLRASRRHRTQTRRSAADRRTALMGRFSLVAPHELTGLHVAIVDDIVTTGGTVSAAVEALRAARPASISVLTLASAD